MSRGTLSELFEWFTAPLDKSIAKVHWNIVSGCPLSPFHGTPVGLRDSYVNLDFLIRKSRRPVWLGRRVWQDWPSCHLQHLHDGRRSDFRHSSIFHQSGIRLNSVSRGILLQLVCFIICSLHFNKHVHVQVKFKSNMTCFETKYGLGF